MKRKLFTKAGSTNILVHICMVVMYNAFQAVLGVLLPCVTSP